MGTLLRQLQSAVDDFRNAMRGVEPGAASEPPPAAEPVPLRAAVAGARQGAGATSKGHTAATGAVPAETPVTAVVEPDAVTAAWPAAAPTVDEAEPAPRRAPRRTWIVAGLGVLALGLVVAVWAAWDSREPADPDVVATYQGGVVTREQLKRRFQALRAEDQRLYQTREEGLEALVGEIVVREVTRRWAEERKVDQKGAFKDAMKHATEEIRLADVSDQLHQGRIPVGEAEIQVYYDQNRQQLGDRSLVEVKEQIRRRLVEQKEQRFVDEYLKELKERASVQVDYGLLAVPEPAEVDLVAYYQTNREGFRVPEEGRVAQIQASISLAGSDAKAKTRTDTARARAAAGEAFAQVARELSDGPEKAQGGELTAPVVRGSRGPDFDGAVFALAPGQLSPVFRQRDSYYVVQLLERRPERLRSYEEVRAEITSVLRSERERQVYAERKERTLFTMRARRTTLGEFLQEVDELPPEAQALYAGPDGKRKLLDGLIERLLVVEDAADQAADVKRQEDLEHVRSDLVLQLLHEEQVDERAKVSDEEVRDEYARNKARYAEPPRVRVRYVRVGRGQTPDADQKARAKIQEALSRVKPGGLFGRGGPPAEFADVARQYSEDPETATRGGDLDRWIMESGDPLADLFEHGLHDALFPLKAGEVSDVLVLGDSYYLFQVRERQEARLRSLEEAQVDVRRDLEARKHETLARSMERDLFQRMQLRTYPRRVQTVLAELSGPGAAGR